MLTEEGLIHSLVQISKVRCLILWQYDLLTYCRVASQFLVCDTSAAFSICDVNPLQRFHGSILQIIIFLLVLLDGATLHSDNNTDVNSNFPFSIFAPVRSL